MSASLIINGLDGRTATVDLSPDEPVSRVRDLVAPNFDVEASVLTFLAGTEFIPDSKLVGDLLEEGWSSVTAIVSGLDDVFLRELGRQFLIEGATFQKKEGENVTLWTTKPGKLGTGDIYCLSIRSAKRHGTVTDNQKLGVLLGDFGISQLLELTRGKFRYLRGGSLECTWESCASKRFVVTPDIGQTSINKSTAMWHLTNITETTSTLDLSDLAYDPNSIEVGCQVDDLPELFWRYTIECLKDAAPQELAAAIGMKPPNFERIQSAIQLIDFACLGDSGGYRAGWQDDLEEAKQILKNGPKEQAAGKVRELLQVAKQQGDQKAAVVACFKILRTYLNNLALNPNEEKYQCINMENKAYIERVVPFEHATQLLKLCGFVQEQSHLIFSRDMVHPKLFDIVNLLDAAMRQLD